MTMQTVVNVSCDGQDCDHVRASDSNHWLVGVHIGNTIIMGTNRANVRVVVNNQPSLTDSVFRDFCGEQCAIKWVSSKLSEIKNDK